MKTVVYPPPGILGLGRSRTVGVVKRPLAPIVGASLVFTLAGWGIPVRVVAVGGVIHVHALAPTTSTQEQRAVAAFDALTDCRVAWHWQRQPIAATCLLCGTAGVELTHELCAGCAGRCARHGAVAPC